MCDVLSMVSFNLDGHGRIIRLPSSIPRFVPPENALRALFGVDLHEKFVFDFEKSLL